MILKGTFIKFTFFNKNNSSIIINMNKTINIIFAFNFKESYNIHIFNFKRKIVYKCRTRFRQTRLNKLDIFSAIRKNIESYTYTLVVAVIFYPFL